MLFDIWRESTFAFGTSAIFSLDLRTCLIFIVSILILIYFKWNHDKKAPPSCGSWIPWIGCAIQFGKQPLGFIKWKSQQYGSIFTLYVAGERLTFLTDPEDFHYFFNNQDTDFQQAVQVPVQNLASISKEQFFKYHTKLHDMVKGHLAPVRVGSLAGTLSYQLNKQFDSHIDLTEQQDLMMITRRCLYASILNTLFGEGNPLVHEKMDYEEFLTRFKTFDEDFELGVKLPSIFLPKWTAAKKYFLKRMKLTFRLMRGQNPQSDKLNMVDALLEKLDGDMVTHKFGMLVMFASIANSVPAAYWTLTYILANQRVREKVIKELKDVLQNWQGSDDFSVNEDDLKKLTYVRCCVLETVRLRSEGIIARKIVRDTKIKGYNIEAGTMLMLSPYWTHRDERYFEEPEVFKPERWENCSLDKEGFIAFGGGRYQCPGRWFGIMTMQTYIAMFFLKYSCTVHSPIPEPSGSHLVGVQHPLSEFLISCKERI